MPNLINRFDAWKTRNLTHQQFLILLSAIIGFAAGLGAVVIKNLTHFIQLLMEARVIVNYHLAFYFVFPIIGLCLVVLITKYVFKRTIGHGIPSTLYAISKKKGLMPRIQMYASLITAPLTVGFGGSVGLEGPTVATGASLGSNISRLFKMNQATRTLLIGCAAAGAMSSIFKAPIAAIVFAIEVFALDLTLVSLVPLLVASVSAVLTSYWFFGSDTLLPFSLKDEFVISQVPYFIILGIVAALCSIYFTRVYFRINDYFKRFKSPFKKLLIGGVGLGILVFAIPPLYGEGFDVINNLLQEDYLKALGNNAFNAYLDNLWVVIALLAGLVVFKIIATSLTFNAGGIGGIFAPVLFMGSTMGHCFALLINHLGLSKEPLSLSNFTLVGMTGLMAGVLHAPLTAIFLIAELTHGYELFIPLMITAAVSFAITKQIIPYSVYTMELAQRGELLTHNKDQAVLTLMDVDQVIEKNFVSLNLNHSLREIIREGVTQSSRNIFPVVDDENKFIGVILLDDLRPIMFDEKLYEKLDARELMQLAPEVIDLQKDTMRTIMRKFQDSDAWNLPVVREGEYIGFVSKSKLLTAYRQKLVEVTGNL